MMADDAEIDEEIERQLEAEAHEREFCEQPLLDEKELEVNQKKTKTHLYLIFSLSFKVFKRS